jgi:hypothetical protein
MRTIIPTTLSDLIRMADYAGPGAEFYVKEITRLDQWRKGVPHLPHNRVWCGLNSFNMPGDFAEPGTMLSLQGAGDLLILSQFIHDAGMGEVTCYEDRAGVLGRRPPHGVVRISRFSRTPTDLLLGQLRHRYEYVSNHPAAIQFLMRDAMAEGWDHYDWFGLMLGIVPKEKWAYVEWDKADVPLLMRPIVVVHARASTPDRSVPDLLDALGEIPYVSLGDGGLSYHESYRLLQQASAVVAVDSVVLHMAVLARPDLPVLGLYTTTPTTWRGPHRPGVDRIHIDKGFASRSEGLDKSDSSRYHKEVSEWLRQHT